MPETDEYKLEAYKARLRREEIRWEAQIQKARASDQAAVALGINAIRAATLLNAGALITLLAFVGNTWADETLVGFRTSILSAMSLFLVGVILSGACSMLAYFYQSFLTLQADWELKRLADEAVQIPGKVRRLVVRFGWSMLITGVAAYLLFVVGAIVAIGSVGTLAE